MVLVVVRKRPAEGTNSIGPCTAAVHSQEPELISLFLIPAGGPSYASTLQTRLASTAVSWQSAHLSVWLVTLKPVVTLN